MLGLRFVLQSIYGYSPFRSNPRRGGRSVETKPEKALSSVGAAVLACNFPAFEPFCRPYVFMIVTDKNAGPDFGKNAALFCLFL